MSSCNAPVLSHKVSKTTWWCWRQIDKLRIYLNKCVLSQSAFLLLCSVHPYVFCVATSVCVCVPSLPQSSMLTTTVGFLRVQLFWLFYLVTDWLHVSSVLLLSLPLVRLGCQMLSCSHSFHWLASLGIHPVMYHVLLLSISVLGGSVSVFSSLSFCWVNVWCPSCLVSLASICLNLGSVTAWCGVRVQARWSTQAQEGKYW